MSLKRIIMSKIMRFRSEISTEDLIKLGLKVGKNFSRQEKTLIDQSHCWLISIGDNVTLAPRVHILAHDASTKLHLGYTRIGKVHIGDNVFIGASSIVLPGVTIGDNSIVGAGSVVTKDIPANSIAVGNPARVVGKLEEFISKNKKLMQETVIFDDRYTLRNKNITPEQKEEMCRKLEGRCGFVD